MPEKPSPYPGEENCCARQALEHSLRLALRTRRNDAADPGLADAVGRRGEAAVDDHQRPHPPAVADRAQSQLAHGETAQADAVDPRRREAITQDACRIAERRIPGVL